MTPAELRCWRESAGLSATNLADMLDVETRAVNRWERGQMPIPEGVLKEVASIRNRVDHNLTELQASLEAKHPAMLYRYSDPEVYKLEQPYLWNTGVSVTAHAAAIWRVHLKTGIPIGYAD